MLENLSWLNRKSPYYNSNQDFELIDDFEKKRIRCLFKTLIGSNGFKRIFRMVKNEY